MYVVFIWYICHLVPPDQACKTLSCCMKDLRGQKDGWGKERIALLESLA